MRRHVSAGLLGLAAALSLIVVGCQKKPEPPPAAVSTTPLPAPFKVTGIELGKALTADKKIAATMGTFATRDTIYAVDRVSEETLVSGLSEIARDVPLVLVAEGLPPEGMVPGSIKWRKVLVKEL